MKRFILLLLTIFTISSMMCTEEKESSPWNNISKILVSIQFNGPDYEGDFYNGSLPATDYAVWIENRDREYVRTVQITPTAVSVGENGSHVEHLPAWAAASGTTYEQLEQSTESGVAPEFDGLTGASPRLWTNPDTLLTLSCEWDITDQNGNRVTADDYYICFESANIIKYQDGVDVINAENTNAKINGSLKTVSPAAPTEHILSITGSFSSEPPGAMGNPNILEPELF